MFEKILPRKKYNKHSSCVIYSTYKFMHEALSRYDAHWSTFFTDLMKGQKHYLKNLILKLFEILPRKKCNKHNEFDSAVRFITFLIFCFRFTLANELSQTFTNIYH